MTISIDVGFGYVKATNESGETLHFPTIIKEKNEKSLFNSDVDYQIKINGMEYYIGEIASSKKAIRNWRNDKTMNEDTEKYVALCCHLLSPYQKSEIKVKLIIGIPYSYFIEQIDDPKLTSNLEGKHFETTYEDTTKYFTINSVVVYPQGVGAYMFNILDIYGTPRIGAKDLIRALVIDIGYKTVDVVAFDNINGRFVLVQENSFSLEDSGTINIVNHIVNVLSVEVQFDESEVERWLRSGNGVIQYGGGEFNVKEYEDEATVELANRIAKSINVKLQNDIKKYKNIFLTGGGATLLFPTLSKIYTNMELQDDCIFCNCKGYLAIEKGQEISQKNTSENTSNGVSDNTQDNPPEKVQKMTKTRKKEQTENLA